MNDYKIKIEGIKNGRHLYTFIIKDAFFQDFIWSEIKSADIIANIILNKESERLLLSIELSGKANNILCDICTEKMSIKISSKTNILIKKTSQEELESNDEVIYVSPNQNVLSIKHLLFELISLSIPNKRRHQKNKNGVTDCNQDMINLIDEYNTIKKETFDPRWNALKELK